MNLDMWSPKLSATLDLTSDQKVLRNPTKSIGLTLGSAMKRKTRQVKVKKINLVNTCLNYIIEVKKIKVEY